MSRAWLDLVHKIVQLIFYIITIGIMAAGFFSQLDAFGKGFVLGGGVVFLIMLTTEVYFFRRRGGRSGVKVTINGAKNIARNYVEGQEPSSKSIEAHSAELLEDKWHVKGSRRTGRGVLLFEVIIDGKSGQILKAQL